MPSTSAQAGHRVCVRAWVLARFCGFVYVACSQVCVSVCILWWVTAYTNHIFTDFNDRTFGLTSVCVPWDLLLLTEGVKGQLTFAFHPDSRWTANQVFVFAVIVELV